MSILPQMSAEHIAYALDKPRKHGPGKYQACCPAHDDTSPSFSITQKGDQILFYCFAGCSQGEVIEALRSRGLWPEEKKSADVKTLIDRTEMLSFCLAHEYNLKRNIPTSTKHQRLYSQYQRVLCSPFTPEEVAEMKLYCLTYSDNVKAGYTPTTEEDELFMLYQRATLDRGMPYEY